METKRKIKVRFMDYWSGFAPSGDSYLVKQILDRHFDVEVCEDADYVFFSAMGESHWAVPDRCVKIFHTGENVSPDFNACDYAIGFDWMVFGDRFIRMPLYMFYEREMLDRMVHKHELKKGWDLAREKPDFCSFVVSNPLNPYRNEAFRKLCEYKNVDSGGKFLNNVGGPVSDKYAFESRHKFSLCFENGAHSGYTTEKLVQALSARTPLYVFPTMDHWMMRFSGSKNWTGMTISTCLSLGSRRCFPESLPSRRNWPVWNPGFSPSSSSPWSRHGGVTGSFSEESIWTAVRFWHTVIGFGNCARN